jgi:hypothetical protein
MKITITEAKATVKDIDFGQLPKGWTLDMEKIAKAYKTFCNQSDHQTAIDFIKFNIHQFRVITYQNA